MANIFDYLNDVAYDSFYDLPVNELFYSSFIKLRTGVIKNEKR